MQPVIRGTYNVTNTLKHVLDLVSDAKATKTTLSYMIRKDASELGRQDPGHVQDSPTPGGVR